ncbi:15-hydroxyprostaglandin dehydrogenase (NAD(+)) [Purpureocillium takamizusanense]|uniref:15-hydroxyprostaglandin dehydrogenase (NAD(+)) n=1 Tax=Purpureocillium takamizusanense TaxID=2060973 RepID=A0A9Q8QFL5_9HYPO|nr:15-hydroxyprostaglandin dehydrogenase (NAD(+)) [Purpureocillium takamizusanense]UNI18342.1 15-hydroxyprostaglandin dehydrogenase (NAD(+)) [Purpureocillium takamizusanense]
MADIQENEAVTELGPDNVLFVKTDVASWEQQRALFTRADEWAGSQGLAFLAANAGLSDPPGSLDGLVGKAKADEVVTPPTVDPIQVNLLGAIYSLQLFAHFVRKRGRAGKAVLTSSGAGIYPMPSHPAYAASKHAIVGYTRSIAPSLKPDSIAVNAILPGFTPSNMTAPLLGVIPDQYVTSLDTMVAAYDVFLDDDSQMTGQVLEVSASKKWHFRDHPTYPDEEIRWLNEESAGFFAKVFGLA